MPREAGVHREALADVRLARHAMSVHVTHSSLPFRMTANTAPRKTDGAPYGSRSMTSGLTGSVAERHSSWTASACEETTLVSC